MMDQFNAEIVNIATMVIVALVGVATRSLTKYLKKKGVLKTIENNQAIVKIAVNAVEQVYKSRLKSDEKLQSAMDESRKIMFKHGIKISDDELKLLVEATVREAKTEAKKVMDEV